VLLEGKSLNDAGAEIARHFNYGGKIKRVYVTADQLKALNAGELGVLQQNGRYLLVTAAVLDEAEANRYQRPAVNLPKPWELSGLGQLHEAAQVADRLVCFGGD